MNLLINLNIIYQATYAKCCRVIAKSMLIKSFLNDFINKNHFKMNVLKKE